MTRLNLGLPYSACQVEGCRAQDGLMRCSACHVVKYCSRDHQMADRLRHKLNCNLIKKSLAKVAAEEAALRARTDKDDPDCPPHPFETAVGLFWSYTPTRPYMRAVYDLVIDQLNIRTGEAVEAALANALNMLRLCRADNLGVRREVPALFLRLGRDQEAFDFVKWYASGSSVDPDSPFMITKGADALEPIDVKNFGTLALELSMKLALLLLKARLYADLSLLGEFIQNLGDKAPADKMKLADLACMTDIVLNRPDIVYAADFTPTIASLKEQMLSLYRNIQKHNKYIIPALENPGIYADAQPGPYTIGSEGEAILTFRNSWYSWSESRDMLDEILPLLKSEL